MKKEQIDWQAYRKDLVATLSNERLWANGYTGGHNPHIANIVNYEAEIKQIDAGEYDEIISAHSDVLEYFNDFQNTINV